MLRLGVIFCASGEQLRAYDLKKDTEEGVSQQSDRRKHPTGSRVDTWDQTNEIITAMPRDEMNGRDEIMMGRREEATNNTTSAIILLASSMASSLKAADMLVLLGQTDHRKMAALRCPGGTTKRSVMSMAHAEDDGEEREKCSGCRHGTHKEGRHHRA